MFYEVEKVQKHLCCTFCDHQFSDVVKLIPECGNSICGECEDQLRDKLDKLPAQYTCKACGEEDHTFVAKGLPINKSLMDLVKTAPRERPLSDQSKKLRELIEKVDEEIQKLTSFIPEQYISEHFDQLEDEVNEAAESGIKHLNEIRSDLLRQIQERRQECLDALLVKSSIRMKETKEPPVNETAQLSTQLQARDTPSKLQQKIGKLSRETSEFVHKWEGYFKRVESYASEQEIAGALDQAEAVLQEIEKFGEASKLEATKERWIRFEANNLFSKTKHHLGKLASYSVTNDEHKRGEGIG